MHLSSAACALVHAAASTGSGPKHAAAQVSTLLSTQKYLVALSRPAVSFSNDVMISATDALAILHGDGRRCWCALHHDETTVQPGLESMWPAGPDGFPMDGRAC